MFFDFTLINYKYFINFFDGTESMSNDNARPAESSAIERIL